MTATVLSCTALAPSIFDLWLQLNWPSRPPRAGQFAHLRCGEEHTLRRPISLCDVEGDRVRLVFEVKGGGTRYLAERRPGDTIDLLYPLGRGFTAKPEALPTLLVGGGLGIPPLLLAARRCEGKAEAILGYRSAERSFLTEDFARATKRLTLCSDDGSLGERGFVDAPLKRRLSEASFGRVLCCGPRPMLNAAARVCAEFGVVCEVSMEERMACGLGACLGCAIALRDGEGQRFAHVCKDGPVFDASEVIWDI